MERETETEILPKYSPAEPVYEKLDDGLVLRQATIADRDQLVEFNRAIHDEVSGAEVGFLLDGWDTQFRPEDFLVVIDPAQRIVSTLCLIVTRWKMGQTVLRFGQPEFVGTLAEYRGRGLVRRQFDIVHRWMKERDLAFGLIGGIDYYYRQFGYQYAVDLLRAGQLTREQHAGRISLPAGVEVRPIQESDIPALERLSAERDALFDLTSLLPQNAWRWAATVQRLETVQVENWIAIQPDGTAIGSARVIALKSGEMLLNLFSGNETAAQAIVAAVMALPGVDKLRISGHPAMAVSRWVAGLHPRPVRSAAWYIRINHPLSAFQKLAGELERRMAASEFAGLSRELELGMYRFGLRLVFEQGKITLVQQRPGEQDPKIGIPPDLLPQLLMGYRTLDELANIFPDLRTQSDEDWKLLQVLFPRLQTNTRFYI